MASVKSLGLHPPLDVDGQPIEGKYTWDVIVDDDGEDELLTVGNCVTWKRGGLFRKSFNLEMEKDEPILQALLTYFPTTDADYNGGANSKSMDQSTSGRGRPKETPALAKALVVFLKTQAHIFFLSGTSHIVHMPFEVESACAAPTGVIIQRKLRTHNLSPVSLRLPRVPPNSFISSHISQSSLRQPNPTSSFSVEGLGQPKTLPLRLSATMENMFDGPLETNDSHWPRLVCLTDPLLELGLIVNRSPGLSKNDRPRSTPDSPFLDLAEEILHVECVEDDLVLAVTANREANSYTIWQLSYIQNDDIFTKHQKRRTSKLTRRRSSMQPRLSSGATTPIVPSFRESLGGAPLPGKRPRRSETLDKAKSDDIAVAFGAEYEAEKTNKQSRRVSSLLARADLSASHERNTFAEQSTAPSHAEGRRLTGAQRARQSGGPGSAHLSVAYSMANLSNVREAEDLLDELRSVGDFGGFHDMGLDDHSFDGLNREMLFNKVHSVSIDNTNVRYSLSQQPARIQAKVFFVKSPPFAADETGGKTLLIGIQDPLDKRLQLLPMSIKCHRRAGQLGETGLTSTNSSSKAYKITPDVLRRAYNVVDSCKASDGDQSMILILSENAEGQRELSIQAPWSAMTTITLPMLYADSLGSLEYTGTHVNRAVKGRRSVGLRLSATDIVRVRHTRSSGVVDLEDREGKFHRVQIQLRPSSPQVRNVLQACGSVLPIETSEKLLAGWWQIMKWTEDQDINTEDREWSCLTILLFTTFLNLVPMSPDFLATTPATAARHRRSLDASYGMYEKMLNFTAPNGSACPLWMQSQQWRWMADENTRNSSTQVFEAVQEDFLTAHIRFAKDYMKSSQGQQALGLSTGHLPTALNRSPEDRARAAWGIIYALHLLLEEGKLDVMAPEYFRPGRADIRAIICQIGQWLGWHEFVALNQLGIQTSLDPRNNYGMYAPSACGARADDV